MPSLYFTCPAEWRGTGRERDAQILLMREFPEHRIGGPHQKNRELTLRRSHPAYRDPNRYFDSARMTSDFCVALVYDDGRIPADVFDDISWFVGRGTPVFSLDADGSLTRYEGKPYYKQVLSLQETQERLRDAAAA